MTDHQWLFFVILPIVVTALGGLAVLANDWAIRREDAREAAREASDEAAQPR